MVSSCAKGVLDQEELFTERVIKCWNSLPKKVEMFKRCVDMALSDMV